ncbi:RNA-binding protein spenito [Bicyclus anynana]|uniref:RNA-binding protein spenito n=1 Tax=Bicyclus anynana TaxID=110368 RepID=A0A6J1NS60_BICAN|nr:RNA-binding protein spenito [Bicyclus anynana]XP_052743802.1 RNA-binding protein spenito [Bicyclus anynana]
MIGLPRSDRDRDRITVKIRNMKRSSSRDSMPRSKRTRSSIGRYDDSSDERVTPDRVRRRVRSPSPRGRYVSPHRDDYVRSREVREESARPYYKVLCVSALHPKASDDIIKDTLYREYKKFGDFSIKISHELDERVAYVCFRSVEDAKDAKHAKPRIILYDKVAIVDPVYEPVRSEYRSRPRSITPPDYERPYSYAWSPVPERRRPPPDERAYGMPPAVPPHHRDFRPPMHDYPMAGPHGPPMHHRPPMHHPPHPHYMPRPYMPRPHHPPFEKMENKKDKFPNYLHHVQPEDDPLATRTLFAGNLEINISDEELRRIFGRYGIVEDIDIKRPPPGTGNAFAFVRYQTLDMAHRAKVELSGQYIGKFQCKIGYGKATPTTRVWVGGLGPWTSVAQLEREFDRFGAIKKIEYAKGEPHAYILYDSIDAAQAAVKEMRGFPLGGPDRRLRIDFADVGPGGPFRPKTFAPPVGEEGRSTEPYEGYEGTWDEGYGYAGGYRGRGGHRGRGRGMYRGVYHGTGDYRDDEWRRPPDTEYDGQIRRSGSREPGVDRSRSRSPRRRSPDSDSDGSPRRGGGMLVSARTLPEVVRKATTIWNGALILKNSLFPTKFHLTDGDSEIIDSLMKDEEGKNQLRITQRLRLDQPKLDDVQKRIATSSSHAIFLGVAGSTASITNEDSSIQTRPMRNLVSYLKQKEAAGVISLLNKETEATGVLYSFPPCDFSTELLKRTCHNLTDESLKEDHLVIVVVRGGSA